MLISVKLLPDLFQGVLALTADAEAQADHLCCRSGHRLNQIRRSRPYPSCSITNGRPDRRIEIRIHNALSERVSIELVGKNKQTVVICPYFEAELKRSEKLSNGPGIVRLKIQFRQFAQAGSMAYIAFVIDNVLSRIQRPLKQQISSSLLRIIGIGSRRQE